MPCPPYKHNHYTKAMWSDVPQCDLEPQGDPEVELSYRHEVHLSLLIRGEYEPALGMLAVRCELVRGELLPISMLIPETPAIDIETNWQSGPRRVTYGEEERD